MAFQALEIAIELTRFLREPLEVIAQRDPSLANQLRRAGASVPLNLAEARRRAGGDRLHQFRVAAGSADEVTTCLRVAEALGYIELAAVSDALDRADRVRAIVWKLTH
jgi:four helix bundle protein